MIRQAVERRFWLLRTHIHIHVVTYIHLKIQCLQLLPVSVNTDIFVLYTDTVSSNTVTTTEPLAVGKRSMTNYSP